MSDSDYLQTEYADLEVSINRGDPGSFTVQFRFSRPRSEADNRMVEGKFALSEDDFFRLRQLELDTIAYGQALAGLLFADPQLLSVFVQIRTIAQTLDMPLRIRLLIGPSAPELHKLHWETLRDPTDGSPLFTNENLLFSRYLSSTDWRPVTLSPRSDTRALVMIANPKNLGDFNLAPVDIQQEVRQARDSLGDIPVTFLPDPNTDRQATLNNLFTALRKDRYPLLYLVCHGTLAKGQAWIWLEDDDREVAWISGTEFVTRFNELQQRPQLIVLASCRSASADEVGALNSLGPLLAEAGIPAVIAMQGDISMETVSRIMPIFFEELQRDGQVDRALAVARGSVRDADDYWMPALYMRLRSGRLWPDPASDPVAAEDDHVAPAPAVATENAAAQAGVIPAPVVRKQSRFRVWQVILALIVLAGILLGGITLRSQAPGEATSDNMVRVEAGTYASSTGEIIELPAYWLDRFEVTNAQYQTYLEGTGSGFLGIFGRGSEPPAYWTGGEIPAGLANHPVHGISWNQADEYCAALGKSLPSQVQWEYAARGPFGWDYPWGNIESDVALPTKVTYPIGTIPTNRSFFGAYDMAGNVWEWVDEPYLVEVNPEEKVMLGGGNELRYKMDYAITGDPDQALMMENTGFRCAGSVDQVQLVQDPALALQDDFSKTDSGWPSVVDPPFIFDFHPEDWYHLEATEPNRFVTATYDPLRFASFVAETEVFVDAANTDHASGDFQYGLTISASEDQFFAFVITAHSKEWQILIGDLPSGSNAGNRDDLTVIQSGRADFIHGSATETPDRLTVSGNGPTFTFAINGHIVGSFSAPEYRNGQIGFIAVTLADVSKVHIHFEWVSIQRFEPLSVIEVAAATPVPTEAVPPTEPVVEAETTTEADKRPEPRSIGMVRIDPGVYPLGANNTQTGSGEYWIDRYEVTNEAYARFLAETAQDAPDYWQEANIPTEMGDHPVQGITWEDAQAYCDWSGKRLPSELEWEVAARGPKGWLYPWGDQRDAVGLPVGSTYSVGSVPANRSYFGVFDMVGNVAEWVDMPFNEMAEGQQLSRGGHFDQLSDALQPLAANPEDVDLVRNIGFRCATDQVVAAPDPALVAYTFADVPGDSARGWRQGSVTVEKGYFIGFHPTDFYHVEVGAQDACLTVFIEEPFANFSSEIISYVKDTERNGGYRYGLAFSDKGSEFYAFVISPLDQTWSVVKNTVAGLDLLDEGVAPSLAGFNEESADRLQVIYNDSEMTLFVNGELVSRVYDDSHAIQQIGFIVQTRDESFVHIHFDALLIQELSATARPPADRTITLPIQPNYGPPCEDSYPVDQVLVRFQPHLVQPGETLSSLASFYGVSQEAILNANAISDPNLIVAGATFLIPLPGE